MTGALERHFSGVRKNLQFVHLSERGKDIDQNTNLRGLPSHLRFPKRDRKVSSDLEYTCHVCFLKPVYGKLLHDVTSGIQ